MKTTIIIEYPPIDEVFKRVVKAYEKLHKELKDIAKVTGEWTVI